MPPPKTKQCPCQTSPSPSKPHCAKTAWSNIRLLALHHCTELSRLQSESKLLSARRAWQDLRVKPTDVLAFCGSYFDDPTDDDVALMVARRPDGEDERQRQRVAWDLEGLWREVVEGQGRCRAEFEACWGGGGGVALEDVMPDDLVRDGEMVVVRE